MVYRRVYKKYDDGKRTVRRENKSSYLQGPPMRYMTQLEEVKAATGFSNTDLIKLGAGIAQEEIKAKLANITDLESRLTELEAAIE